MTKTTGWLLLKVLGCIFGTLLVLFAVLVLTQGPVAAPPWWGNDSVWWPDVDYRWWEKGWENGKFAPPKP
jgi:hypothetical protein